MGDPELGATIQRETNKSESFNGFAKWLAFGNGGVIPTNNRREMRKYLKYNHLLANIVIFANVAILTQAMNELVSEGHRIDPEAVAFLSPYITQHLVRYPRNGTGGAWMKNHLPTTDAAPAQQAGGHTHDQQNTSQEQHASSPGGLPTLTTQQRRSVQRRIEAYLAQIKACQAGEHRLEATKSPGVLVCRVYRIVGVCLWCGLIPPAGAVILVCPAHRDFVRLQAMALGTPLSALPIPPAATTATSTAAGAQEQEEE